MVCGASLFFLVVGIASTTSRSPCFVDAKIVNSFGMADGNTLPPRTYSEKVNKKKITPKHSTKSSPSAVSESGVNSVKGGYAIASNEDQTKVPPIVFHSIFLVPLLLAWRTVSQNLSYELSVAGVMFSCLFAFKFVDAIVDDGLHIFKGASTVLSVFIGACSIGLPLVDDFAATFFAGLTLDSWIGGKLDCIEFKLIGALMGSVYAFKYFSGNFSYQFVDMLAVALSGAVEEFLHDKYDTAKVNGKKVSQFVEFFHDSRLFSVVTLVPLFMLRGGRMGVVLMIAQEYGYEVGSYISTAMLKRQNERNQM